ncbi:MAG: ABC transporter substrate-binding protein [Gammaproteobacteria bacterium]
MKIAMCVLTRRQAMIAIAASVAAVLGAPAYAQETKLTIMVFQGMQNLPILAAQSKGFFAKRGISVDVKIAQNSDEMRAGLADGRWQIIHTAVDNGLALADVAKVDIAIVSGGDNSFNHLFVQPDINSVRDLRGKTVIVDAVATAYAFQLYEILKRNGLNKGDYQVQSVGGTFKRLAELEKNKDYKGAMLNPPFTLRAQKIGMKDLGSVAKILGPYQATGAIVLRSWAKDNSETLVKYLQAYVEGLRWSLDARYQDEATKLLGNALKLPLELAAATYALAVDPKEGLAKDARFDMEGFKNVLKLRADWTGAALGTPEKYLDLTYYAKALAGL